MASTINATSTGSGGLITTGNSVNQLELQTGDTTRVVIDSSGNVTIQGQGDLRLADSDSSHYVALQAPGTVASNVTFTLPSADGTNGQVLQTNGSGTLSFATPSGGAWIYLSTVNASAASTADVETTFDSTYDQYVIIGSNVTISNAGQNFQIRLKIGGSYITTGTYGYTAQRTASNNTTMYVNSSDDAASEIRFVESMGATSSKPSNFMLYVSTPSSTSVVKNVYWNGQFTYDTATVATYSTTGTGRNTNTGALTGVRFFASAGTVSGTFRLYGIKNS